MFTKGSSRRPRPFSPARSSLTGIARLHDELVGPTRAGAEPCRIHPHPPMPDLPPGRHPLRPVPRPRPARTTPRLTVPAHGLCGRTYFILPNKDPAEFPGRRGAVRLHSLSGRTTCTSTKQPAPPSATCGRRSAPDRLEAVVAERPVFTTGRLADPADPGRQDSRPFKALGTLLRRRARIDASTVPPYRRWNALRQRATRPRPGRATATNPSRPCPRPLPSQLPLPMPRSPSPPFAPRPGRRPRHLSQRTQARPRPGTARSTGAPPPWTRAGPPDSSGTRSLASRLSARRRSRSPIWMPLWRRIRWAMVRWKEEFDSGEVRQGSLHSGGRALARDEERGR